MRTSALFRLSIHRQCSTSTSYQPPPSPASPRPPPPPPSHQNYLITPCHQTNQSQQSTTPNSISYLKSLSSIIKKLSKNPRNYNSLAVLDSFLSQIHFYNSAISLILIDYLSQIKKIQRAQTLLLSLKSKGKVSDFFLYGLVFDFLAKDGKINDVEILWKDINNGFDVKFDISDYVIHVSKCGGMDEIRSVCERVLKSGRVLREKSYVALIGALCRVNDGFLAKMVVKEMIFNGFGVDGLSYFVMFQCFCINGDVDEADLILRILVERNFDIDVCIYGNFLYALCKSGKFREADKLFRKLVQRDSLGGSKEVPVLKKGKRVISQLNCEGAIPVVMAYEAYFRSLCSVGRLDEAEVVLKKLMNMRTVPEICVYGSFIKALFRVGRGEDAMKFYDVERRKGIARSEEMVIFIIKGLCENGRVDDAFNILKDVRSRGSFNCVDACNCILDSYWNEGRVAEAVNFFEKLQDGSFGQLDSSTYMIMAHGYCVDGNIFMALHIFEELVSRKHLVNEKLYGMIIGGLCVSGRLEEALNNLNNMIENGYLAFGKRWKDLLHIELEKSVNGA
ncbi:hypothetical protein ACH5RR_027000 [Cinchona calisaya]|uniref:Pentatricopeptide repeat-containing protein n=1 Tax=Cinchona calisaya TaxID=153742 RepID=A0ABD2Z575_9GENT